MDVRKWWGRCELLSTPTPLLFSFFPLATRLQIKQTGDLTRATPRGNEPSWHTPPPASVPGPRPEGPSGRAENKNRGVFFLLLFSFPFLELESPLEILVRRH